jgi:hypothetical protein
MAEILIKAVSAVHADAEKDRRGCYKAGMPVVVMPDGHQWGTGEAPPAFVVLKLPGVTVARVNQFIESHQVQEGLEEDGTTPKMGTFRRRLWRIHVEDLPQAVRNRWLADGEITIGPAGDYTWAQFRQFMRNQSTMAEAADLS